VSQWRQSTTFSFDTDTIPRILIVIVCRRLWLVTPKILWVIHCIVKAPTRSCAEVTHGVIIATARVSSATGRLFTYYPLLKACIPLGPKGPRPSPGRVLVPLAIVHWLPPVAGALLRVRWALAATPPVAKAHRLRLRARWARGVANHLGEQLQIAAAIDDVPASAGGAAEYRLQAILDVSVANGRRRRFRSAFISAFVTQRTCTKPDFLFVLLLY